MDLCRGMVGDTHVPLLTCVMSGLRWSRWPWLQLRLAMRDEHQEVIGCMVPCSRQL